MNQGARPFMERFFFGVCRRRRSQAIRHVYVVGGSIEPTAASYRPLDENVKNRDTYRRLDTPRQGKGRGLEGAGGRNLGICDFFFLNATRCEGN